MKSFISNHQYNEIKRLMQYFQHVLKFSGDKVIIAAAKEIKNEEIKGMFSNQPENHILQVDIGSVNEPEDVDIYLKRIEEFTFGIMPVSENQIRKLFKKEKKFKTPTILVSERKSYYGWVDQGKNKLYVAYWLKDELIGMICNIKKTHVSNSNMCSICGYMDDSNEVVSVSVRCKTLGKDNYHVIGFNICKDSSGCNSRITSVQPLENLLKKVNRLKTNDN